MKKISFLIIFFIPILINAQDLFQSALERQLREKMESRPVGSVGVVSKPLERLVDANQYILGPGDVIRVALGDQSNLVYEAPINPEGMLLIPSVEPILIAHLSLAEAKEKIIEKFSGKYLSRNISVHLIQLRSFRVSVNGAVVKPGMYEVTAMNRVSEAIQLAGGLRQSLQLQSETQQVRLESPTRQETQYQSTQVKERVMVDFTSASQRNITILRADGSVLSVDLQKYALTGDLSCNPYLLDGDVVFVPTEEKKVGRIKISGAVKSPDEFEYVKGDCIKDILEMAHGFTTDADSNYIELVRFIHNSSKTETMRLSLDPNDPQTREKTLSMPLQPDDRLFVRYQAKFHVASNVEVLGEVLFPGEYDIIEGKTTLSEIIKRAGGFTANASLKNARVIRKRQEDLEDPEFERLKKMNVAEMTESEREYFKIKSRELVGGMGIDFRALFEKNDRSKDILLSDRDQIIIPAIEQTVKITGQVVFPGLYTYVPGKTLNYYLKEAGGYNWNARKSKVRLIRSNTGEWVKPNGSTIVEVGDTIFVPEKPERNWWTTTKEVITAFAQLATIYIVVTQAGKL